MAEQEPNKGGRPSHADLITNLSHLVTQQVDEIAILTQQLIEITTRVDLLEHEAAKPAPPASVTDDPSFVDQLPNRYCDGCGAMLPFHFESKDGEPCALAPEPRPAETAAA